MLKVFLVEDESIIRETLRDTVPWNQCGYSFVGEASDGEMALPLIRERRPDVLITDIRMPFMDGLELSRQVLEEFPDMKVIILSGYDDFEYAQKAISIGVERYLLKPITKNTLIGILQSLREKVEERSRRQEEPVPLPEPPAETVDLSELGRLDPAGLNPGWMTALLQSASPEEIGDTVPKHLQPYRQVMDNGDFRSYLLLTARFTAAEFLLPLGADLEGFSHTVDALGQPGNGQELEKLVIRVLQEAVRLREKHASHRYRGVLTQAAAFIDGNFSDEKLSLNQVAREVNVSPNYLSAVFSQEMGCTFVEYVTSRRMDRARELLRSTRLRSGEVAAAVGYKDPHYFSFLFKKTQGCTPREYRAEEHHK